MTLWSLVVPHDVEAMKLDSCLRKDNWVEQIPLHKNMTMSLRWSPRR